MLLGTPPKLMKTKAEHIEVELSNPNGTVLAMHSPVFAING